MKKILFFLIVSLSLSSPASAVMDVNLVNEAGYGETSLSYGDAPIRSELIATASGLLPLSPKQEANGLIKDGIDAQAGKVNKKTIMVMAAAALFVFWLNRKRKQEFD
ncbi:MAG: hypothetical protein ACQEV0_09405 [Bacillota bacterium]